MRVLSKVINMKKAIACFLLLLVSLLCSACQNFVVVERRPCSQPNTKWESEDGTITFTVDSGEGHATGKMIIDGNVIEFYMTNDTGSGMHIFPINALENSTIDTNSESEYWLCSYKNKKKFVATVNVSTHFSVGEKIVFYRVDNEHS